MPRLTVTLLGAVLYFANAIGAANACDKLELSVTGQLSSDAPILSPSADLTDSSLHQSYKVPLNLIGGESEKAELLFTRTTPTTWRVDVIMDSFGESDGPIDVLKRPAATLLDFVNGRQEGTQLITLYPVTHSKKATGASVIINLENFSLADGKASFLEEYSIDRSAECHEPRRIIHVKTKSDAERDELNPYKPGEKIPAVVYDPSN